MNAERWKEIERIFDRVIDAEPSRREALLDSLCGGDDELRREVASLLAAAGRETDRAGAIVTRSLGVAARPGLVPGDHVGPYELVRRLGEGGMGEVFEAVQQVPLRRRVAVKVIRPGLVSESLLQRFAMERQALALMDHPGIASVYDAGETEEGRPYFVMELVEGERIDEYCRRVEPGLEQKLELFVAVCRAVQHAHQRGILHRDLKPSNVLVAVHDGKPSPKVIDFGIAKGESLTDRSLHTQVGQLLGTPQYMSPEQATSGGIDVDTRSDVYSLGVVLYELLVGDRMLVGLDGRSLEEMLHSIRDSTPVPPSRRLAESLQVPHGEPGTATPTASTRASRRVRGEIDWIVMKAIEKERARRYESVADLADDIERHLRNEPVLAGPPSRVYRLRKLVRRHRAASAAAAVALASLLGGATLASVGLVRATRSEAAAVEEAERSARIASFLEGMIRRVEVEPFGESMVADLRARVGDETARTELDRILTPVNRGDAARRVIDEQILTPAVLAAEEELAADPKIAGRLLETIARTYRGIGLYDRAESAVRRSLEIGEKHFGREHVETQVARHTLALVLMSHARYEEARELFEENLELKDRLYGVGHPDTLNTISSLGSIALYLGDNETAARRYEQVLAGLRTEYGVGHPRTMNASHNLGITYRALGRLEEAEGLLREVTRLRQETLGPDHFGTLKGRSELGWVLVDLGRYDEAEVEMRQAWEIAAGRYGEEDPEVLRLRSLLGLVYERAGRHEDRERLEREVYEQYRGTMGDDHPHTLIALSAWSMALSDLGRQTEAEAGVRRAIAGLDLHYGVDHARTFGRRHNLSRVLLRAGRAEEAEEVVRRLHALTVGAYGPDDPETLRQQVTWGEALAALGRYDEAAGQLEGAVERLRRLHGDEHPDTVGALAALEAASF
jgi:eukaryotic-like serine/threonine-protein kinase